MRSVVCFHRPSDFGESAGRYDDTRHDPATLSTSKMSPNRKKPSPTEDTRPNKVLGHRIGSAHRRDMLARSIAVVPSAGAIRSRAFSLISGVQFMAARALTFFKGQWLEGNPGIIGPMSHCMWLSSVVFDGARAFEGVTPDLDLHCERVIASAHVLGLAPMLTAGKSRNWQSTASPASPQAPHSISARCSSLRRVG